MTPRQRLFAALEGAPTDHVPVWLLFPYHPTPYYADVHRLPVYRPIVEAVEKQGKAITLDRRHLSVPVFAAEVKEWREEAEENGVKIWRHILEYRGRRLIAEQRQDAAGTRARKMLTCAEDLEFFCALPVNSDEARISAELDRQLPTLMQERAEFPLHLGGVMLDLGEPIAALYHAADLEEYAVWSLTHGDLIVSFLERVMAQKRIVYRYCLERDLADIYFFVGSELASPPLVSRSTFQRWIVPYAAELIALVRAAGKKAIQHYHGFIRDLLPDFRTMAPDGLHTIEAPPVGNCTFSQAYEELGDSITLIGNVQYDDFRAYTPERMRQAVRDILAECRGRRLILSPTAGPYESDISPRMQENYLAFLDEAWRSPALR
ncbi:MAG: uroporphyrinogen decarboxylase family protein [Planctomycetota bacterium]|nr:uroporphyrinogen decarboxylase family protein [Planctomycetota bacterium]